MRLIVFDEEAAWAAAVVEEMDSLIEEALAERRTGIMGRPRLRLCLAGGSTPEPVYRALARRPFSEVELELWPGDERHVAADDPARNGRMIELAFKDAAWKPGPRFMLWPRLPLDISSAPAAGDPLAVADRLCTEHEATLRFEMGEDPFFDLALLGLGSDGHTASLFPGQSILAEKKRLCAASIAPLEPRIRLSFTYPLLARTRRIRFLARGAGKAQIVIRLASDDPALPAARIEAPDQAILYCTSETG
ncbi:MAG: 6-phosphogluconolactonase [Rectinemataceae bacterium]